MCLFLAMTCRSQKLTLEFKYSSKSQLKVFETLKQDSTLTSTFVLRAIKDKKIETPEIIIRDFNGLCVGVFYGAINKAFIMNIYESDYKDE